ncbi:MAG: LPS export ABC transporter permease LptG [Rhodocyclaceae bacterium]
MSVQLRYLAREIYGATALVLFAFLALFAFFDLVAELGDLGKGGYRLHQAVAYVLLTLPGRVYELFPIAVLIGTLFALTTMARHSEITVLRASGLSTGRLIGTLCLIGASFVVLTFLVGEYAAPPAERAAQRLRLEATSSLVGKEFRSGMWLKDDTTFVNVRSVLPDGRLKGIWIYRFDAAYRLLSIRQAEEGQFAPPDSWRLTGVVETRFTTDRAEVERLDQMHWQSALNPEILAVLMVVPERMTIGNLYRYIEHLADNRQRTERYEIALWKKVVYPIAAIVMMVLALPFALRQHRFGGVSVRIFAGVMIGIGFHMLNGLSSSLGIINNWPPPLAAFAPSALFLVAAGLMLWVVERR